MRYAVISDIHSNLEALRAVLKRIKELNTDAVICLGDIVGYNANPNECVDLVRNTSTHTVSGNHDEASVSTNTQHNLNPIAEEAIIWTRQELTRESKVFLMALPTHIEVDGLFTAFHAPRDSEKKYIRSKYAAEAVFEMMARQEAPPVTLFGHTHIRSVFMKDAQEVVEKSTDEEIVLEKNNLYLINPGSVGQPRGGDPRASFLTIDTIDTTSDQGSQTTSATLQFHSVEYDMEAAARKVRAAGLAELSAKRITIGR